MTYLNGFLLGLSTGIFCFSYCAPIYLPQLLAQKDKFRGWTVFIKFNAGRLMAYAAFGALFGWLGGNYHANWLNTYADRVMAGLALLLIAYGLASALPKISWCAWAKNIHLPFVTGLLLGVNICPPFLIALVHNFRTGSVASGILFFIAFYIGTTLYLVPITFLGYFAKVVWLRQAARIAAVAVGIILLIQIMI